MKLQLRVKTISRDHLEKNIQLSYVDIQDILIMLFQSKQGIPD